MYGGNPRCPWIIGAVLTRRGSTRRALFAGPGPAPAAMAPGITRLAHTAIALFSRQTHHTFLRVRGPPLLIAERRDFQTYGFCDRAQLRGRLSMRGRRGHAGAAVRSAVAWSLRFLLAAAE